MKGRQSDWNSFMNAWNWDNVLLCRALCTVMGTLDFCLQRWTIYIYIFFFFFNQLSGDMRSVSSVQTKSRSKSSDEVWGWSKLISIILREKQLEWFVVPVPASSSCGQRRGESQRWRPTACCGPATVGCLCRGPSGEGGGTWGVITQ